MKWELRGVEAGGSETRRCTVGGLQNWECVLSGAVLASPQAASAKRDFPVVEVSHPQSASQLGDYLTANTAQGIHDSAPI